MYCRHHAWQAAALVEEAERGLAAEIPVGTGHPIADRDAIGVRAERLDDRGHIPTETVGAELKPG